MTDVARLAIVFSADTSALDKGFARAKKQVSDFQKAASKESVKLDADSSGLTKSLDSSTKSLGAFHKEAKKKVDVDVDKNGAAAAHLKELSGGFGELSSNIRQFKTIATATTLVPGIIAGIGALPAAATAAAGAVGQLSIALGQGLAGAAAIGGTALIGAQVGLRAYSAVLSRTISDSRAAFAATHENAMKQLEMQRNTILNTQASKDFNNQLNESAIALTKVEAAIGEKVFPSLTKLLDLWTGKIPQLQKPLMELMEGVTNVGVGFATAYAKGQKFQNLKNILDFVATSGNVAAETLADLADAGIKGIQPLIPLASTLQIQIFGVAEGINSWVNSARGTQRLTQIFTIMNSRMYTLIDTAKNLGLGLVGVFSALNATGGPQRLLFGLNSLSEGFARIMEKGNGGRQAIIDFMNAAQPTLNQLWRLTKTVVVQFGLLASNVIKAGQAGGKMGTLASVIKSVRESIAPLRGLFQDTFIALGPVLSRLIPEAADFLSVFLGSSGPLKAFLNTVTGLLHVINRLPGPVKSAIVNLVALKTIFGVTGLGAVVGPVGNFAANMFLVRSATARLAGARGLAPVAAGLKGIGTVLAGGIGLAAVAGAFYLAYQNSDQFHDAVNKLAKDLQSWGKEKFAQAKAAVRDIFDVDKQRLQKMGYSATGQYGLGIRNGTKSQTGEGSPAYEFGFKVGKSIGSAIGRALSGRAGEGGAGGSFAGGADNPIGEWLRSHVPGAAWLDDNVADPIVSRTLKGIVEGFRKSETGKNMFGFLEKQWNDTDKLKYQGSALQKIFRAMRGDSEKSKKAVTKDAWDTEGNLHRAWQTLLNFALPTWASIGLKIRNEMQKSKEDGGKNQRDLESNLKSIWQRILGFAKPKWLEIAQAIIDGSQKGKEQGGTRNRELEGNLKNIWDRIWNFAKPRWLDIAQALISGSEKGKEGVGKSQRENETNTKNIWQRILDNAGIWGQIGQFMVKAAWDAKRGVENAFNAIIGLINRVLSAVHLPTINLGGSSGGGGGGSNSGPKMSKNTSSGQPGLQPHASGGVIYPGERVIVGDAPKEYIINPERKDNRRYLDEAAGEMGYGLHPLRKSPDANDLPPFGKIGIPIGAGPSSAGSGSWPPKDALHRATGSDNIVNYTATQGASDVAPSGAAMWRGLVKSGGNDVTVGRSPTPLGHNAMALTYPDGRILLGPGADEFHMGHEFGHTLGLGHGGNGIMGGQGRSIGGPSQGDFDAIAAYWGGATPNAVSSAGFRAPAGYSLPPLQGPGATRPWTSAVLDIVRAITWKAGGNPSSYSGHPGGDAYSSDWWGMGGRGDNIDRGTGDKVHSTILSSFADKLNWTIWRGQITDAGGTHPYTDPNDQHYDHVHGTFLSPGKSIVGGGQAMSLWDLYGEKIWNALVQPAVDRFSAAISSKGGVFGDIGGAVLSNTASSIKDYIIGASGSSTTGGISPSGTSPSGLTLGEAVSGGGWPEGLTRTAIGVAWEESGANASARNPSGARGLFQIMPGTASAVGADYSRLDDPIYNSAAGKKVYDAQGWGAWVAYPPSAASMGRGGAPVTGYRGGGIIPGEKGKPVLVRAHSGERILPQDVVRGFDRLARSIEVWNSKQRTTPPGSRPGGGDFLGGSSANGSSAGLTRSDSTFSSQGGSVSRSNVGSGNAEMLRNSQRGANANEDAARTLRRVERILARLPQGIREGVNHNMKHGLETGRSMDASDINRMERRLSGGAPIARKR